MDNQKVTSAEDASNYSNFDFILFLVEYIHNAKHREILYDRFVDGMTFAELENKHFISERQLKRIVKKADHFFINLLS